jgi:hypothetical protein
VVDEDMGMRIGIVGAEAAKFTPLGEVAARAAIGSFCYPEDVIISGGCHLGGVDTWAIEEAKKRGCETVEHLPKTLSWFEGYRPRNILIAEDSDLVICIVVNRLPKDYKGMKFPYCYHCHTMEHVKSGGCWTMQYAKKLGKDTDLFRVTNYEG